ncbi:hypothetical protein C8N36_10298 [Pelagimonas varians]|uniref:Uncharacterized protein n=2 Tax=Pelagimonas varians TaxID=696760 RepID=A0A238JZP9_9RHOB|nr:hypothetical protein C8N36_10298 [Pelagimonas varians]SMX35687.1 hypothetical protein PEV8663_00560 [Pelagimonas varians]
MDFAGEFATLFHSSLSCAGDEIVTSRFMYFWAVTFAHVGLATIVSAFVLLRDWSVAWLWAGFALIVVKELGADLPNAGWSTLVWFDSLWDLASWFVGFFALWWAMMADRAVRS